ncbi:MAG: hypothetical protein U0Q18_14255 [Bryobacteraceae bacterium]
MRSLTVVLCAFVLSSLAAAQPAKSGPSPCTLLTKAEVQEAAGAPVSDGTINATQKSICDFKAGGGASAISIMLTPKAVADKAETTVAELKKRKIDAEMVPGFGDGAYASSPGYGMQQLGVYKGTSHVIITVLLFGQPDAKSKAVTQTLMRKALARLP